MWGAFIGTIHVRRFGKNAFKPYLWHQNLQNMTVIFQIETIAELDEISQWLAKRKIVVQKMANQKVEADVLMKRLRRYKIKLPTNYRFNRDEANER